MYDHQQKGIFQTYLGLVNKIVSSTTALVATSIHPMKVLMFRGRKYHGAADMVTTVWDRSINTTIILSWSKVTGDLNVRVSLGAISTMGRDQC